MLQILIKEGLYIQNEVYWSHLFQTLDSGNFKLYKTSQAPASAIATEPEWQPTCLQTIYALNIRKYTLKLCCVHKIIHTIYT